MSSGESYSLSVVRRLGAESIHILREVAAECERPVMPYSVGKDSSVKGKKRPAERESHTGELNPRRDAPTTSARRRSA